MFLGAIGGELSAELPFVLMHPKPNMKKILKADTLAEIEGFQVSGKNLGSLINLFFFIFEVCSESNPN